MKLKLTDEQKIAATGILIAIAYADEIVKVEENVYIKEVFDSYNIPYEFVSKAKEMNIESCIEIINNLTDKEKKEIGSLMHGMMNVDGDRDAREEAIIDDICIKLNIPKLK
jgi:uncharacterized tellurite resistance protein B-like protein